MMQDQANSFVLAKTEATAATAAKASACKYNTFCTTDLYEVFHTCIDLGQGNIDANKRSV